MRGREENMHLWNYASLQGAVTVENVDGYKVACPQNAM